MLIVVQRLGWVALAVVGLAALAGLLGPGPLSSATRTDPSGLVEVEHHRFARQVADTDLRLTVRPDPAQPGTARVWISADYLSSIQIQQVQPEPESWTGQDGGVVLTFPVTDAEPVTVLVQTRPDQVGLVHGAIGAPGREPAGFWQFVYP